MVEDFINRILGDNAVRAGQKLPPLLFKEVKERTREVMDRKADYARVQDTGSASAGSSTAPNKGGTQWPARRADGSAFTRMQTFLKSWKGGMEICV